MALTTSSAEPLCEMSTYGYQKMKEKTFARNKSGYLSLAAER